MNSVRILNNSSSDDKDDNGNNGTESWVGTWSCVIPDFYYEYSSVLTLKPNGKWINVYYDDEYGTGQYEGSWCVVGDKIIID